MLGLACALAAGCAQTAAVRDRPDLAERITRGAVSPTGDGKVEHEGDRTDRAGGPAGVEGHRADDPTAALSLPASAISLEEALELAMRFSPVLAQSRAALDAARANVEIADAGFRPTIQGNESFQAFSSQTGFSGTPIGGRFPVLPVRGFGPGSQDFNLAEAQLKWTVFQFGKQMARHGQAVLRTEIADLQLKRSCQSVAYEVGQAYFRVLEAKAAVEIAVRAVQRAEAFRAESAALLRRGVITREEHLRVEARVAVVRQERADARSAEEVAVAALNRAMGIDVNAPTRVAERRQAPRLELPLDATLKLAAASRPEIPVMVRGITVAEQDVRIARADFLPSVSIQAGYSNISGTNIQNANVAAGGIFVTHELYGGGRRRGQLRAAEAGVRSAIAQAQQVCDGIAYEVNAAFHGVEDAWERIASARATHEQASENLRLVSNRFRTGDATPAELMEARAAETAAEQTYNAAFYLYQRAIQQLEYAVGAALPTADAGAPTPPGAGPSAAAPPPGTPSPFRPSSPSGEFPGLPPPLQFGGPGAVGPTPLPQPPSTPSPGTAPMMGPPSLSRPPYESNSPFGVRP